MADTISQRYDVVYHALNSLGNDLPDPIGQPIQTASEIMSTLWTSGQKLVQSDNAWKLMVVMTAHQDAHNFLAIVDYVSKILQVLPKASEETAQLLRASVLALSSATQSFKHTKIPETWESEINRRCPVKLATALKSPSATIVALLAALKHSLTRLSAALSAWVQPLPVLRPTVPQGLQSARQIARPTIRVGQFDTRNVRCWQGARDDTLAEIHFPHSYIAPPRLPHGFRYLDADQGKGLHVKATIGDIQEASAVYHATSWASTTLYSAVVTSLNLAPANIDFDTGEHRRDLVNDPLSPASVPIQFGRPFVTPPKVAVFFNLIDIDPKDGCRIRTTTTKIDNKGFTLTIESWGDTDLRCAQACWIAFPEDRKHVFLTSVNTAQKDVPLVERKWSKAINLTQVNFWRMPDVFVALNELDFDGGVGLRMNAYVDNVATSGLTWHLKTWSDSILRSAGATIIAVN